MAKYTFSKWRENDKVYMVDDGTEVYYSHLIKRKYITYGQIILMRSQKKN